ncbi:flagellar brake domain-containing protein [Clostridium tagluense]|uniref:flagellar brake protein n=1 Tax=Clostridium tagluense TaxID=360422 RepID=UPI001C0D4B65|nr:flagellar brake domain-containing protein [Clostridium tagluense]MBU3126628.1 flagellar brake domain-containing protein [Clostridium tagluense]MCB2309996.1 flagellar brake domain-containing protein [Clostridium tagluense]MCB2314474.1 flagellar brake domain-containing protein [Clostridium tagluense]MCB2319322.1 flagellar brake domain-containing protein [Clostridium tagluense]MCB2324590.1 flagellar brake domain-containing protein [Clostridium tagluense]
MIKVDFAINRKLEILVDERYYNTNIQDLTEEYIAISIPMSGGQYVPLSRGDIIDVIYYEDENLYKFKSSVIGRKIENIPILLVSKPLEIEKIQRRKYVRISLINTAKYKNLKNQSKISPKAIDESEYLKASIVDLSGGGMKVRVSEEIVKNDFILVNLTVNNEDIHIVGQAKRIQKDDEGRFVCGLSFEFLDNLTRERIIKYIFQLMREQMKKI